MSFASNLLAAFTQLGTDYKAIMAAIAAGGGGGGPTVFKPWFRYRFTVAGDTIAYDYEPGLINVYKDGHLLRPDEDYDSTSGDEIVFVQEQEAGVEIDVQAYSLEGLDAANARVRIDVTATTQGQTSFTGLSFPTGEVDIYRLGWILPKAAYTENGTSFTLAEGADLGDEFTIIANRLIPTGSFVTSTELTAVTGLLSNLVKPERTNLVAAINSINRMKPIARTLNVPITEADNGDFIRLTGTFSQSFDTVPEGFWVLLNNASTGEITLATDGVTYPMYSGEVRCVYKTATRLDSFVINPFEKIYTSSGTFSKSPGYRYFDGFGWGAGAGGGKSNNATYNCSGGGGGACKPIYLKASALATTENVTIGAGGTPTTTAGQGGQGGDSYIGTLWRAYGGGPGGGSNANNITGGGGGGGGHSAGGAASTSQDGMGGGPYPYVISIGPTSGNAGFGGGGDGGTRSSRNAAYGGGAGGDGDGTSTAAAGKSIFGGGGGGGSANAPGGTSDFGGRGGQGNATTDGEDGVAPGGGGGATRTGSRSGAGARGEIRIRGVI